jgi:hypothetical protein
MDVENEQPDWQHHMTAKAALKQGLITPEEFAAIRKASKLRKLMMSPDESYVLFMGNLTLWQQLKWWFRGTNHISDTQPCLAIDMVSRMSERVL